MNWKSRFAHRTHAFVDPLVVGQAFQDGLRNSKRLVAESILEYESQCLALTLGRNWNKRLSVARIALLVPVDGCATNPVCHHANGLHLLAQRKFVSLAGFAPAVSVLDKLIEQP